MAIRSKVTGDAKAADKCFPKLMTTEDWGADFVMLFEKPKCGVILSKGRSPYDVGHHSDSWIMTTFVDYDGAVTLQNK